MCFASCEIVGKSNSSVRSTRPGQVSSIRSWICISASELAPTSNRLSSTSTALPGSRSSTIALSVCSISPGGGAAVAVRRRPGEVELRDLGRELAVDVGLGERRALQLSAGRLRYAPDRDDARDLDAGVLVDEVRGARRERQEVRHAAAMQDEQHQLVGRCTGIAHAGGDDLAQLESRLLLQHCFQVVRVVVLAVDEDDLLGAAGDVVLALVHQREVAGPHPAIRADRGGGRFGIAVVTARDVVALDQEMSDHAG